MTTVQKYPFMSIVICVFNGERDLSRAIESLMVQDYPKNRFEIIVVDDGSYDRSFEIACKYSVKVVQHPINLGISAARTTGLAHAKGEVYVCFDHDCVVGKGWLKALATGYEMPGVVGAGSIIAHPENVRGIIDHFMVAQGSGNPISLGLGASKSPLKRFLAYIVDQLHLGVSTLPTKPYPVRQLNGATASFPISVLQTVGGWDTTIRWMEDTDLRARIMSAFPDGIFYAVPAAQLIHDPKMSLRNFIRRSYIRGLDNLRHYRRTDTTPPIFPFPILWIAILGLGLIHDVFTGLILAILLPHLLYFWWPIRCILERNLWYILFPYVQLAEELASVAGLLRGYLILSFGAMK